MEIAKLIDVPITGLVDEVAPDIRSEGFHQNIPYRVLQLFLRVILAGGALWSQTGVVTIFLTR